MVAKQRRPEQGNVRQPRHRKGGARPHLGLHISRTHKGRKPRAKQRECQPCGVLVGVEPDHQQPKNSRQNGPRPDAGGKTKPVVTGVHHGSKTGNGGAQHDALGPQVDEPTFSLINKPSEARANTVPALSVAASSSA